jgi:hypothetical protein
LHKSSLPRLSQEPDFPPESRVVRAF